jgi:type VI secretion system protein ImpG
VRDDLLFYYERELTYLRQMGAEFGEKYPKIASRLLLEPSKCEDPHVERILEAFAFLTARVHLKIDDDFPEITESLLNIVYPHYIRPIPSMSVVQFHLDPDQGELTSGFQIPRESMLYSRPVGGVSCRFRTCFDTTLWPLSIEAAEWKTPERISPPIKTTDSFAVLRLDMRCVGNVTFDRLELSSLRFYVSGESNVSHTLYELLANNVRQIIIRDTAPGSRRQPIVLPGSALRPAGFEEDEAVLPYSRRSFAGYRLLQEYFTFPQKFLFFDLSGLEKLQSAGFSNRAEFLFLVSQFQRSERQQNLEVSVSGSTFRLGCSPVVNLFPQTSEPILLDQKRHEYVVVPDARRQQSTEAFSIEKVIGITPHASRTVDYEPLYAFGHSSDSKDQAFWYATRRPCSWRSDGGSDVYVAFVDISGRPAFPEEDAITVRLTCFNRDLPSRLPFGNEAGDFELEAGGPVKRIVALTKPTAVVQPQLGKGLHWRLISQLALNYLSVVDGGAEALREILRLYNATGSVHLDRQIQGILNVDSQPCLTQIASDEGVSFVRGRKVRLEFDEEQFAGGGVYLFASVIERFLGLYVSLNSFSVLEAQTRQRKEVLKEWPPRAGARMLL